MRISFSACKQTPLLVNFPGGMINMDQLLIPLRRKEKVVVVMGATGTGKSRLSIDLANLASRFNAEVINSDKMQVYKGLDIVTNKVTEEECGGVPHHLLMRLLSQQHLHILHNLHCLNLIDCEGV